MKKIVFRKNYIFNGKEYKKGETIENIETGEMVDIWRLNEKGIIEPLTEKEFEKIVKEDSKKEGSEDNA